MGQLSLEVIPLLTEKSLNVMTLMANCRRPLQDGVSGKSLGPSLK